MCRICRPAAVSPGSNVRTYAIPRDASAAAQQLRLGGLADPVAALEDDEQAGSGSGSRHEAGHAPGDFSRPDRSGSSFFAALVHPAENASRAVLASSSSCS